MNSTYSKGEGADGICFSSVQWQRDGQSYVGGGAGLSSMGGPIHLPDDSDSPTCLFLHPHLTPLAHTQSFLFLPHCTVFSSLNLLFFISLDCCICTTAQNGFPTDPFSASLSPTCLSSGIMEKIFSHVASENQKRPSMFSETVSGLL